MEDLIGQKLGQYEITALIGTGGMARVYRGRQESMKRDVAIKVIRADLTGIENFIKRFEHEAQTVASLTHPHILKVFDYGQQGTMVYLVMELLSGGNLADMIRESPLAPDVAVRMLDQIASALDYAHQQGVIHRDLKPQNVLLDRTGNAYLTDFGIAKMLGESSNLTQPGTVMGTPSYMAPELWNGEPADARSDVYALGIMLYEMLNGRVPFSSDTPFSLMTLHMNHPVPSILAQRPDLPETVEAVINKALSKQRDTRYGSAGDLAAAFRLALTGQAAVNPTPASNRIEPDLTSPVPASARSKPPSSPGAPTPLGPSPDGKRRLPLIIGLMVVVIVILGAAAIFIASNQNAATATPAGATISSSGVAVVPTATPSLTPSATLVATAKASLPTATPTPRPMTTIDYYTADAKTAMAVKNQTLTAEAALPTATPNLMTTIDYLTANAKTAMAVKNQTLTAEAASATAALMSTARMSAQLTATSQAQKSPTPVPTQPPTLPPTAQAGGSPTPVPGANQPGGGQIAFISNRDGINSLYVMGVNGENPRRLTRDVEMADPAWSPDGTQIAFAAKVGDWDIVVVPAAGGQLQRLTTSSADERHPTWSLDGKRIAYAASSSTSSERGLYVMDADGTNRVRLGTDVDVADPAWSPDGRRIAYAAEVNGQWGIVVINPEGGDYQRLTTGSGDERFPAWSPDGKQIAYATTSPQGETQGLHVMNGDGGGDRQLTHGINVTNPSWSPDGTQIVYTAQIGGRWNIFVIPAQRGDARQLTVTKSDDTSPAWSAGTRPVMSGSASDVCLQNVPLRIGISIDFPELGAVRDNPDVVVGFGVELSNLLLDDKGIKHRFHGAPLPALFGSLVKGDFDLVINQLPINDQDARVVNFSDPYFVFRQTFTIRQADKNRIQALADLRGKTVGVTQGKQGLEIAEVLKKELGGDLVIRTFPNGTEAMQALANQKVDAVIEDNLFALHFVAQNKGMNLVTVETARAMAQFGIIVRKECPALLSLVNDQLAAIIRDGRYAKLYVSFFGVQPPARFRP